MTIMRLNAHLFAHLATVVLFAVLPAAGAFAQEEPRIENRVAVFSGLDKISGKITTFDVYVDETVKFGQLQITPRICLTSPPSQQPRTTTFLEVDEITLDRQVKRLFTGWMFAESPGLNAIEHPVNDVWLKECKQTSDVPPPPPAGG